MAQSKVWLVTGASKGLGFATVERALAQGYKVAATSRDAARLCESISASPDRFLPLEVTLTDEASIAEAVRRIVDKFGQIDVLVNNAGYAILGAIEEISDQEARANFDVNVFGVLNMLRAVLPVMRRQNAGHVINIASISGSVGAASTGIYSATKAAVILLSESLVDEVAEFGISVTAVCPGGFRTDFLDRSSSRLPDYLIFDYLRVHSALSHFAQLNGRQGGDPDRAAEALVAITELEQPPTRLYLGGDALGSIELELRKVQTDIATYQTLSLSTDYAR